jgi:hypothetical protein
MIQHTIKYAKGWYKRTDIYEDMIKTLTADGYMPDCWTDIVSILIREVSDIYKNTGRDHEILLTNIIEHLDPTNHRYILSPNEIDDLYKTTEERTHYFKTIIYSLLAQFRFVGKDAIKEEWIEPDYTILPKSEKVEAIEDDKKARGII